MFPTLLKTLNDLLTGATLAHQVVTVLHPVLAPNPILATIAALASVVALAVLSGIAVSSVFMLVSTLIALYFILTEVLGIRIELNLP